MVCALDSGSECPGSRPGRVIVFCCVLGQDTLVSQCLSPPRTINGYQQIVRKPDEMLGGYLSLHASETGISSGSVGH